VSERQEGEGYSVFEWFAAIYCIALAVCLEFALFFG